MSAAWQRSQSSENINTGSFNALCGSTGGVGSFGALGVFSWCVLADAARRNHGEWPAEAFAAVTQLTKGLHMSYLRLFAMLHR